MPDGSVAPRARRGRVGQDGALVIGLVNAMPPAAMRSAEWQFRSLLEAAATPGAVHLRYFALPGGDAPANDPVPPRHHYESLDALWDAPIDGLIVTGTEPREPDITREACWPAMAAIVDWAERNTVSTIWSCFAAHAAVFRLDGIRRQVFPRKLSGVFACAKGAEHPLIAGAPPGWHVPHSRHNTLAERDLMDAGYDILSRAPTLGADMFARHRDSLFLMLQGHPEYGADTLLREYRRDVMRFLTGQSRRYPDMPENYLPAAHLPPLAAVREQALCRPHLDLLASFDAVAPMGLTQRWREHSVRLFARWLCYVAEHAEVGVGQLVRR